MEKKKLNCKWQKVLDWRCAIDKAPLVCWIDLANGTLFRMTAFFTVYGLNGPRDGLFVAIEGVGAFLFALHDKEIHWEYVGQKLFLSEPDARAMADWINTQQGIEHKMQGIYDEKYINEVEPYGLMGEKFTMPLHPEIIDGN